ncbi:MAG: hypothetical protein IKA36_01930 [Clostridia bacterium]|nr:hypothetical protein [Clostridia bacterium]
MSQHPNFQDKHIHSCLKTGITVIVDLINIIQNGLFTPYIKNKTIQKDYITFEGYSCGGLYYSCFINKNYFDTFGYSPFYHSVIRIVYDADNTELIIYGESTENYGILFDYSYDYRECRRYHSILTKFSKVQELIRIA